VSQSVQRLRYGLDSPRLESRQGNSTCLFSNASITARGPTQPPQQWVPEALYPGVKQPGREADHPPPPTAEVKNVWSFTSISIIHLHGPQLYALQ
jgi:hypothetical protein